MSSKQKLKLKKKEKTKEKSKTILSSSQKVALRAVQKQLQNIQLKEILFLASMSFGGALLRIPMQVVPSAEPITFFAILAGWLFGRWKGFSVGLSSLYLSNFFMFGGQGPWTIFQAISFGIAGWLGGLLRKKASYFEVIIIALMSTLIFELIMNGFSAFFMGGSIFIAFALAVPFMIVHIASNIIFSLFLPFAKKTIEKGGSFDEKSVCVALLDQFDNNNNDNRLKRTFLRQRSREADNSTDSDYRQDN